MLRVQQGPIYFLPPKWGRVCRVFNTRNYDFNPLKPATISDTIHTNRDFNSLAGNASYALYTQQKKKVNTFSRSDFSY